MATTLFSSGQSPKQSVVPSSIIKFISEASARYNDLLKRQAFCTVSVDAFVHAESAERDYLGRISQGFFAFHALGVFGDAAIERLRHAKETVWLVDSNAQIPVLALAVPTHAVFANCFSRLRRAGIRLFTTELLFDETWEHLRFADNVIKHNGSSSPIVIVAATGQPPYRNSNQFLEGFIRWQSAGNPREWEGYLFQIFEQRSPSREDAKRTLQKQGVEVIAFQDWPGFSNSDFQGRTEYTQKIGDIREGKQQNSLTDDSYQWTDLYKKAEPEAEASVIVRRERNGDYHIISSSGQPSDSWFISNTSILNIIDRWEPRITWQPEAFLRFASTLSYPTDAESTDRAFETILFGLAESALSLLDEKTLMSVFGGIIDQTTLNINEQQQIYKDIIEKKYGEPLESVLNRVPPLNRPTAVVQLLNEVIQAQRSA